MPPPILSALLAQAIHLDASDLHLSAGSPPWFRVLGNLAPIPDAAPLAPGHVTTYRQLLQADHQLPAPLTAATSTRAALPTDFTYHDPSTGRRFRVNAYTTVRGPALTLRLIPAAIRTLDDIDAPPLLADLALLPRGLVLVTGPTGSGKSLTLAAMVDHINRHRQGHILTLEDPIEHLHENKRCLVSQRELHTHARGYAAALKDAMREDPDVILVGEMRDPDTIRMALTAAETGHLVLSTLHTNDAAKSIDRIIDVFPANEKEVVRAMLAGTLQAVIAQHLVRHRDEARRLAVFETLICNHAIRGAIKDNQTAQIRGLMSTNASQGMTTLDQALAIKVRKNQITAADAARIAHDPNLFKV